MCNATNNNNTTDEEDANSTNSNNSNNSLPRLESVEEEEQDPVLPQLIYFVDRTFPPSAGRFNPNPMNSMTFVMQSHSLETIGYGYNDHNDQQQPWGMPRHDSDDEDDEPPPRILPQSDIGGHCIWVQSCGVQNWLRHSCQQDLGSSHPRLAFVGNMESSMPPNTNDDSATV